jgi:hypothetical protein
MPSALFSTLKVSAYAASKCALNGMLIRLCSFAVLTSLLCRVLDSHPARAGARSFCCVAANRRGARSDLLEVFLSCLNDALCRCEPRLLWAIWPQRVSTRISHLRWSRAPFVSPVSSYFDNVLYLQTCALELSSVIASQRDYYIFQWGPCKYPCTFMFCCCSVAHGYMLDDTEL